MDWIGESISEAVRESLVSEGVLALEREDRLEAFRRLSLRPNAVLTRASMIKAGEALDASESSLRPLRTERRRTRFRQRIARGVAHRRAHPEPEAVRQGAGIGRVRAR